MRWIGVLFLLLLVAAASIFYISRRETPPVVAIEQPQRLVGQTGTLTVTAETPGAKFKDLTIAVEQNGQSTPLFSLDSTAPVPAGNMIRVSRPFGKQSVPQLRSGPAKIVVSATRKSFLNLRTLTTTATKDVEVRLEPPRIAILSTHHYVNHGGAEMVVYRATPPDVVSGVRVGDVEYLGFPASGTGQPGIGTGLSVAFFSLLHDQNLNSRIVAFARDDAGNESTAGFVDNVFEKPFKKS